MVTHVFGSGNATVPTLAIRWQQLADSLSHRHAELDVETFAAILATFRHLQHAGLRFDPMLVALMAVLERQAFLTGDDTDQDKDESDDAPEFPGRAL